MHYAALILAIMIPDAVHAHIAEVVKVDHIVTAMREEATARVRGNGGVCDTRGPWQSATYRITHDARDLKWTRRGCRPQHPLNAEGRAWLAEMVQLMLRNTGMEAEARVALLLGQGGHDAVLAELPHLGGDRVQRVYLAELMTQARLNGAAYQATMRAASENISSDHEWQIFVEESNRRGATR